MTEKKRIRAIFFDMDGTLVSFRTHKIPDSAKSALLRAKKEDILLFAATGRHPLAVKNSEWLDDLGFSGHVTLNGQYCIAGDTVVYQNPIDIYDLQKLHELLKKTPFPCMICEADRIYINRPDALITAVHEEIETPIPPVGDIERILTHPVYQICLFADGGEYADMLRQMPHCTATSWHHSGVDIIPANGDKWNGIAGILKHYGIEQSEIAAFGDGENDLTMLSRAGWSVAMGNAPPAVKNAAKFVTKHIDDDGIAYAFQNYLQI